MYHAVARHTEPGQIRDFVDLVQRKLVVNVMTVSLRRIEQRFPTALAFSLIPVKGILAIHKVLEIRLPAFTTGVHR